MAKHKKHEGGVGSIVFAKVADISGYPKTNTVYKITPRLAGRNYSYYQSEFTKLGFDFEKEIYAPVKELATSYRQGKIYLVHAMLLHCLKNGQNLEVFEALVLIEKYFINRLENKLQIDFLGFTKFSENKI